MASERTTKVRISAQIQEYVTAMQKAADVTRETGTAAEKLAQKKQAFQTLGTGLTVAGGAMTALTLAVAKTGIEYNTLQQTSRAALTTLLGGAEAANAQMDKLDAFARTSPFSKSVFIEAQQQLLGFGMTADRVVPTLDAIQNAVAATGGSNQDIAELTRIIAQLSGGVKISAETFNQFGTRGVDAAGIIGEAMGKTGQQIREEVTAGTLDADAAVRALVDGMQERFAGAADGVKDTFAGAVDRVQAAWRDLSADLMKPLVDPNGGGILVDFANDIADVTRGIQALPEPVKIAGGAIWSLVGLIALGSGAYIAAIPKIAAYKLALEELSTTGQRAAGAVGALTKAAGAAAVFFALAKGAEMAATAMGQMGDGAKTANETLSLLLKSDYDGIFDGIVPSVEGLGDAFDKLLSSDPGDAFNRWGSDVFAFTGLTSSVGESRKQFALLGEALTGLVNSGDADRAAELFEEIAAAAEEKGYSIEQLNEIMPQYQDSLVGVENDALMAANSVDVATSALDEQADSVSDLNAKLSSLIDAINEANGAARDAVTTNANYQAALEGLNDLVEKNGTSLDQSTASGSANAAAMSDLADKADLAAQAQLEQDLATMSADEAALKYIGTLTEQRQKFIDAATAAGLNADEVNALAGEIYQMPSEKDIAIIIETAEAHRRIEILKGAMDTVRSVTAMFNSIPVPGQATGGPVVGPGTGTSDSVPRMLSNGEHVITAEEVRAGGGHGAIMAMRAQMLSGSMREPALTADSEGIEIPIPTTRSVR